MDLTALAAEVAATIANADVGVVAVGGGTHQEVGNRLPSGLTGIRLPAGIVAHEPDDLTVTALAGTTVRELQAVLAASGQEVPLDPRDADATVGGVLAAGLSGTRRLRLGPVRDTLLEVRFVDGTGTLVTGGGPVVKNVSGYDIPRLLVGSLGTLGVIYNLGDVDAGEEAGASALVRRLRAATWDGTNRKVFTLPVALSIMVFFALCAQCASTLVVIGRETNSWRWPIVTFVYMTTLAYIAALLMYQIGSRLT